MMYFVVVPILVFFFLKWKIYDNVSYLVTIETLKVGVLSSWIVSSYPFEILEMLRFLVAFLIEVILTYYSLIMGGYGFIIFFKYRFSIRYSSLLLDEILPYNVKFHVFLSGTHSLDE